MYIRMKANMNNKKTNLLYTFLDDKKSIIRSHTHSSMAPHYTHNWSKPAEQSKPQLALFTSTDKSAK